VRHSVWLHGPKAGLVHMQLGDFEALSFDCYGTLIDWEAGLAAALRPWARAAGLSLDDEALLAVFARHEGLAENEHPRDLYPAILAGALRGMGAELGAPVTEADAARLAGSVPDWPAFSDSPAALAALAARYQLIILSNVDRGSFAGSARRLGVTFSSVLTAQDIGSYKPAQRNFGALLAEARRLGVGAGKLLHVAQSLFHDHVPAKRAGLATVWINRRRGRAGWGATPPPDADVTPDWEFGSMAEFADAAAAATTQRLPVHGHSVDAATQGPPYRVGADDDRRIAACLHWQSDM
jgi:2-haloacid dehalogenase